MSVEILSRTFNAQTTGTPDYDQDLTVSGIGTPSGCIVELIGVTSASSTKTADAIKGVGFASGSSNQFCYGIAAEDGVGTTNTRYEYKTNRIIRVLSWDGFTTLAEAEFDSFITDGIRITWKYNPSTNYLIRVTFFCGSGVSCHAEEINPSDTLNGTISTTNPGFKPDVLFGFCGTSEFGKPQASFGIARRVSDSSSTHRSVHVVWPDGISTGNAKGAMFENCICSEHGDGAEKARFTISAYSSTGYTVKTEKQGALTDTRIVFMSVKLDGVSTYLGTDTLPSSTGNDDNTSPGFELQHLFSINSFEDTVNTWRNGDDKAGVFGIKTYDGTLDHTQSIANDNGVATTDCNSLAEDNANYPDYTGSSAFTWQGTASFITNGWRWNWTQFSSFDPNRKVFSLAIEEEGAAVSQVLFNGVVF